MIEDLLSLPHQQVSLKLSDLPFLSLSLIERWLEIKNEESLSDVYSEILDYYYTYPEEERLNIDREIIEKILNLILKQFFAIFYSNSIEFLSFTSHFSSFLSSLKNSPGSSVSFPCGEFSADSINSILLVVKLLSKLLNDHSFSFFCYIRLFFAIFLKNLYTRNRVLRSSSLNFLINLVCKLPYDLISSSLLELLEDSSSAITLREEALASGAVSTSLMGSGSSASLTSSLSASASAASLTPLASVNSSLRIHHENIFLVVNVSLLSLLLELSSTSDEIDSEDLTKREQDLQKIIYSSLHLLGSLSLNYESEKLVSILLDTFGLCSLNLKVLRLALDKFNGAPSGLSLLQQLLKISSSQILRELGPNHAVLLSLLNPQGSSTTGSSGNIGPSHFYNDILYRLKHFHFPSVTHEDIREASQPLADMLQNSLQMAIENDTVGSNAPNSVGPNSCPPILASSSRSRKNSEHLIGNQSFLSLPTQTTSVSLLSSSPGDDPLGHFSTPQGGPVVSPILSPVMNRNNSFLRSFSLQENLSIKNFTSNNGEEDDPDPDFLREKNAPHTADNGSISRLVSQNNSQTLISSTPTKKIISASSPFPSPTSSSSDFLSPSTRQALRSRHSAISRGSNRYNVDDTPPSPSPFSTSVAATPNPYAGYGPASPNSYRYESPSSPLSVIGSSMASPASPIDDRIALNSRGSANFHRAASSRMKRSRFKVISSVHGEDGASTTASPSSASPVSSSNSYLSISSTQLSAAIVKTHEPDDDSVSVNSSASAYYHSSGGHYEDEGMYPPPITPPISSPALSSIQRISKARGGVASKLIEERELKVVPTSAQPSPLSTTSASSKALTFSNKSIKHNEENFFDSQESSKENSIKDIKNRREKMLKKEIPQGHQDSSEEWDETDSMSNSEAPVEESQSQENEFEYLPPEALQPLSSPTHALSEIISSLSKPWPHPFHALTTLRRVAIHHTSALLTKNLLILGGSNLSSSTSSTLSSSASTLHHICSLTIPHLDSLRSSLSKNALITIECLIVHLKRNFDSQISVLMPYLLKKSIDSSVFLNKLSIKIVKEMAASCSPIKLLTHLLNHTENKTAMIRGRISFFLAYLFHTRGKDIEAETNKDKEISSLVKKLKKLLSDQNPDARLYSRSVVFYLLKYNIARKTDLEASVPADILEKILRNPSEFKDIRTDDCNLFSTPASNSTSNSAPGVGSRRDKVRPREIPQDNPFLETEMTYTDSKVSSIRSGGASGAYPSSAPLSARNRDQPEPPHWSRDPDERQISGSGAKHGQVNLTSRSTSAAIYGSRNDSTTATGVSASLPNPHTGFSETSGSSLEDSGVPLTDEEFFQRASGAASSSSSTAISFYRYFFLPKIFFLLLTFNNKSTTYLKSMSLIKLSLGFYTPHNLHDFLFDKIKMRDGRDTVRGSDNSKDRLIALKIYTEMLSYYIKDYYKNTSLLRRFIFPNACLNMMNDESRVEVRLAAVDFLKALQGQLPPQERITKWSSNTYEQDELRRITSNI